MSKTREIVVARYNEDLQWLHQLPSDFNITVINKGSHLSNIPERTVCLTLPNSNHGRESESYAYYISERYNSLSDITYFCQGSYQDHNPLYLEFLQEPVRNGYCGYTQRYSLIIPPPTLVPIDQKIMRDENFNLFTLDMLEWHDRMSIEFYQDYLRLHNLQPGVNIIYHHLTKLGVSKDWISPRKLCGKFTYGAFFSIDRDSILQHPVSVYQNLRIASLLSYSVGFIIERSWRLLLERPKTDEL